MHFKANKVRLAKAGRMGFLAMALLGTLLFSWRQTRADEACTAYRGLHGTVLRFTSVDEGRAVLAVDDEWIAATSELQRAALMGSAAPAASREAFRRWQAANVLAWPASQRERWCKALDAMAGTINTLKLPLPREILLINTSGRESADTPHTRGNAIAIPSTTFNAQGFSDVEVLAHELFHVASRYSPELATRLYALIGFEPAAELEWPPGWQARRIADSDAPHHRHLMRVRHDGETGMVMPVVLASHAPLEPGELITEVMELRLLRVTPGVNGQPTRAVVRNGEPLWHEPEALTDFSAKLGQNTDYVIHPEEAMADNFMFLVSGRPVLNPALLRRIEAVLKARAP